MDSLFTQVEQWHGTQSWGKFLDAGTGKHSLKWITTLQTDSVTAITGDIYRAKKLQKEFNLRPQDLIVSGNWTDGNLLPGKKFDVVLADYLLGAIDGFAPYFQTKLFRRLRAVTKKHLYVIGLEPFPDHPKTPGGRLINRIARLRDACILLAGHRCYREYPQKWVTEQLQQSGYKVSHAKAIAIRFGPKYINSQLDVCKRKLNVIAPGNFNDSLRDEIEILRTEALMFCQQYGKIQYGRDYVIAAQKLTSTGER